MDVFLLWMILGYELVILSKIEMQQGEKRKAFLSGVFAVAFFIFAIVEFFKIH